MYKGLFHPRNVLIQQFLPKRRLGTSCSLDLMQLLWLIEIWLKFTKNYTNQLLKENRQFCRFLLDITNTLCYIIQVSKKEDVMNTAQIILSQIKQLDPRATFAWGAKEMINMGDGLKFKSSGMVKWKGYVHIKYDAGQDLYNIDFFKIRGMEIKYTEQLEGVFAEDLVRTIDEVVG
jgi:hypothetical protein